MSKKKRAEGVVLFIEITVQVPRILRVSQVYSQEKMNKYCNCDQMIFDWFVMKSGSGGSVRDGSRQRMRCVVRMKLKVLLDFG